MCFNYHGIYSFTKMIKEYHEQTVYRNLHLVQLVALPLLVTRAVLHS